MRDSAGIRWSKRAPCPWRTRARWTNAPVAGDDPAVPFPHRWPPQSRPRSGVSGKTSAPHTSRHRTGEGAATAGCSARVARAARSAPQDPSPATLRPTRRHVPFSGDFEGPWLSPAAAPEGASTGADPVPPKRRLARIGACLAMTASTLSRGSNAPMRGRSAQRGFEIGAQNLVHNAANTPHGMHNLSTIRCTTVRGWRRLRALPARCAG
jgi:hypothetical protein